MCNKVKTFVGYALSACLSCSSYAQSSELQKLIGMSDRLDKDSQDDFAGQISVARNCIKARDFYCAEEALLKAEKLTFNASMKSEYGRVNNMLAAEVKAKAAEDREERKARREAREEKLRIEREEWEAQWRRQSEQPQTVVIVNSDSNSGIEGIWKAQRDALATIQSQRSGANIQQSNKPDLAQKYYGGKNSQGLASPQYQQVAREERTPARPSSNDSYFSSQRNPTVNRLETAYPSYCYSPVYKTITEAGHNGSGRRGEESQTCQILTDQARNEKLILAACGSLNVLQESYVSSTCGCGPVAYGIVCSIKVTKSKIANMTQVTSGPGSAVGR